MMKLRRTINYAIIAGLFGATAIICIPVIVRFAEAPYIHADITALPKSEVALVLGASVLRGMPSPILEERAHAAVRLYLAGKVDKILVTGDNSVPSNDEVTPVRKYLQNAGIPAGDIFLDHAGFDTYSSMYRAREIFGASSVTIVTQDFHLPRAVFIARALGLTAYGISASGGAEGDYVREIPASIKALLDVAIQRQPQFLGDQIPLSGDGSTTWY